MSITDNTTAPTSNEPDEKLFRQWFEKYGAVFTLNVNEQLYIYRRLSRREYRMLQYIEDPIERSDSLCETVVLWPENFKPDEVDAGIPEAITVGCLRDSGYTPEIREKKEQLQHDLLENPEIQMESVIEYVFGTNGGKFDKYQEWSFDELVDSYERAMWILTFVEDKKYLSRQEDQAQAKQKQHMTKEEIIAQVKKGKNPIGGVDTSKKASDITVAEAQKAKAAMQRQQAFRSVTGK